MQLNDAHVFCQPADIITEMRAILDMIGHAYDALGISAHHYRLSLRGQGGKYAGDAEMWDQGEKALAEVLDRRGLRYESAAGESAFYGPKIDVQILDPAGRGRTLSTVQLDFYQPRQFGLSFVAADQSLQRPVMIHRSIVGSLERLVAHLTGCTRARSRPGWRPFRSSCSLSLPQLPAAASLLRRFIDAGLRAEISDPDRGTLGARIRGHRLVPYQAIVGARETADNTAPCAFVPGWPSIRSRPGTQPITSWPQ